MVPRERFNIKEGINVSEIEFPAFFNFFVRKKKAQLITYPECKEYLYTIMKEALDGPDPDQIFIEEEYSQFCESGVREAKPDHVKEIAYFREPRPGTDPIEVLNLISFSYFNADGICQLSDDVYIKDHSYGYSVYQDNEPIVTISDEDARSCNPPPVPKSVLDVNAKTEAIDHELSPAFKLPRFGMTVLGNSHGFDPSGNTSGFVIWINGQGIMVDPPPHSSSLLRNSGIHPKTVTAIILTHCHADHDAGTMQKIITEDKIDLMTTKTVFQSLIRKYAGVSGLAPELLMQLVNFRPGKVQGFRSCE